MSSLEDLKKELEDLSNRVDKAINAELKSKIDFSGFSDYVIKQGLLIEARDVGDGPYSRYFNCTESGKYRAEDGGKTSQTSVGMTCDWSQIRLLGNSPMPWFGGECPIPDGVRFAMWMRDGEKTTNCDAPSEYRWSHIDSDGDIIAFQILESEWQS